MWRSFWCSAVAAITLKALDPFGTGKIVLFQVHYTGDWKFWELVVFTGIGAAMGVYGALFAKLNMLWARNIRARYAQLKPISEVALVSKMN